MCHQVTAVYLCNFTDVKKMGIPEKEDWGRTLKRILSPGTLNKTPSLRALTRTLKRFLRRIQSLRGLRKALSLRDPTLWKFRSWLYTFSAIHFISRPFLFVIKILLLINTSGVKIRSVIKSSYFFHKVENVKSDIAKIIIICINIYSR